MTRPVTRPALQRMTAEDRASLHDAQQAWSSAAMVALFEVWNLKAEVLRAYKRQRKSGHDPDSALFWALYDWGSGCWGRTKPPDQVNAWTRVVWRPRQEICQTKD